jgi:hypothetical protein
MRGPRRFVYKGVSDCRPVSGRPDLLYKTSSQLTRQSSHTASQTLQSYLDTLAVKTLVNAIPKHPPGTPLGPCLAFPHLPT